MNTDQTPPPEVTPPAGHEILTPEFLREHGAVEGMKCQPKARPQDGWRPTAYLPGASMAHSQADFEGFHYSAPLGTMAARLTPAPAGFRNVLPGWLAGLDTKPEGLRIAHIDDKLWVPCEDKSWQGIKHPEYPNLHRFAYAVPLSTPKFHNPDNLASAGEPPWRFLAEGEEKQDGDEYWYPYGETPKWQLANPVSYLNWTNNAATYRTRRPLPGPSVPTCGMPRCDGVKVDAGWIIASHSDGEFVPLEVAQSMEAQLMDAQEQYDGAIAEVVQLRQQLLAAQTRADVAERERDQAHAVFDSLYGDARPPAKVHRPTAVERFLFAQYADATDACAKVAAQRDLALRELAELKAKIGEKV